MIKLRVERRKYFFEVLIKYTMEVFSKHKNSIRLLFSPLINTKRNNVVEEWL